MTSTRRRFLQQKAGEVEFSIATDAAITKQARAMFDPVLEMKAGVCVSTGRDGSADSSEYPCHQAPVRAQSPAVGGC
jgi:hypothetical protein